MPRLSPEPTGRAHPRTPPPDLHEESLATYSNLNAASGYAQRTVDLGAFAGQTVTLKWTGVEDSSLQTSFVVDDVTLQVG